MKLNTIMNRYILSELLPPFLISSIFFVSVFLMTRILELTSLVINFNANMGDIVMVFINMSPYFLKFVIPISIMISVFITAQRMAADNEFTALRSSGIKITIVLNPIFLFCFVGGLLTFYMAAFGTPMGEIANKERFNKLATQSAQSVFKERVFYKELPGLVIYTAKIDMDTNEIEHVFIEDSNYDDRGATIIAPKGILINDPENSKLTLRLFNGLISRVDEETGETPNLEFEVNDINLDLNTMIDMGKKTVKGKREMNFLDLKENLKTSILENKPVDTGNKTRYYVMIVLPFSCLVFGFLALATGASGSGKRFTNLKSTLITVFLLILYFAIYIIAYSTGKKGSLNPAIGLWFPNVVLGIIAVYLFRKVLKE